MTRPVRPLTLLTTIGNGVTSGTLGQLLFPSHSLVTLVTTLSVRQVLGHDVNVNGYKGLNLYNKIIIGLH